VFLRMRSLLTVAAMIAALLCGAPAAAQQRVSFVRDAEVEAIIRTYAAPLFSAAGLDARAIEVHLINDRSLNAFVANGLNLYINTGLLIRTEHPGQLIGVIAHETGHIQGGHLVQMREKLSEAVIPMMIEMLATMGAMAAGARSGNPNDWGGAVGGPGGPTATERLLLRYSRAMESQADQAGLALLERTGQSSRGFLEFLEVIADQELLQVGRQDPYIRTHPIARARVDVIRAHVERSRFSNTPPRPAEIALHRRLRAKLYGFVEPARTFQIYREDDNSIDSRYARAIAHSRRPDLARAHALMDSLIAERPNDAYFIETKAQFYLEQGKPEDARALYARAAALLPDEALIVQALGNAETQAGRIKPAIATLERARRLRGDDPETWRLLAIAYARDEQPGMAALAQAENFALRGRHADAANFAERAMRQLPANSPTWLRAQDIQQSSQRARK
jgi:predicted Zn-dependent protease